MGPELFAFQHQDRMLLLRSIDDGVDASGEQYDRRAIVRELFEQQTELPRRGS